MTEVDICIVGGGLVGGTLASALGAAGYRVHLVESQEYQPDSVPSLINERSVVLSHSSQVILNALGLWADIKKRVNPIEHIHVSERGRFGVTRLKASDEDVPALGYVVRNSDFLKSVYRGLANTDANIDIWANQTLSGIAQNSDYVEYEITDSAGEKHRNSARLLVAADGTYSAVAQQLAVEKSSTDYEQAAIVANVSCEYDHRNIAYERFTSEGPLALLPLADKLMAMVFTVNRDDLDEVMAYDDKAMLKALQQRFGYRLGRFVEIGERLAFPLNLVESREQACGRVLFLGNAARTLHPVSGQGFNLALRDVALLLQYLCGEDSVLDDPGESALLGKFVKQRRKDQRAVIRFTDSLVRIFRGKAPVFSCLRAAGLAGLDAIPPAKHFLAKQSMGMADTMAELHRLRR